MLLIRHDMGSQEAKVVIHNIYESYVYLGNFLPNSLPIGNTYQITMEFIKLFKLLQFM